MRVLHVIHSDGFAGVERHVAMLAAAQHDAGDQVVVIGGDPASMVSATDRSGGHPSGRGHLERDLARGAAVCVRAATSSTST